MLAALAISCACGLYRADADREAAAKVLPKRYPARLLGKSAAGAAKLDRYWRTFGAPELNRLVAAALAGNHDLRAAAARVRETGFGARIAWSGRLPRLDYDASIALTGRGSAARVERRDSGWTARIGVAGSYELDLWGRMRAKHRSALATHRAARWDHRAARMTIAAEVTLRWLDVRAARAQLALLASQRKIVARTAAFLERRYRLGGAQWTDLLAQRQTLKSLEAQRAAIRRDLDAARAELRLLVGAGAVAPETITASTMPSLPPLPGAGLPAQLVERRPDVQAAWQGLLAAAWTATAAKADRLPTLNITGSFAFGDANPPVLFQSWVASALAGLAGPLFHFGARKAAADAARAAADVAREKLKQKLLEAFRDVERALAANRHLSARAKALEQRAAIADQRAARLGDRFRNGTATYLEHYVAELEQLQAQQALLAVKSDLLAQRVQLARALGGGWQRDGEKAGR